MYAKHYSITVNNPTVEGIDHYKHDNILFLVGQLEKGKNNTPHL